MRVPIVPVAVAALGATLLSGCSLGKGLYGAPLPGGANLGSHPYSLTVQLSDALDLVPQSGVKVNDVAVGKVTRITLESNGRIADVEVRVNGQVHLPANAVASVQQTSLLGEKYIALSAPLDAQAQGTLAPGSTIDVGRTSDGVEVEQVLGALSLLLNGGGIGQLQDITKELNTFAHGHEPAIRTFLASTDRVVAQLSSHKQSIVDALDALNTLAGTLRTQNTQIARVLTSLAPGIQLLSTERTQLIAALNALNSLSTVTVQTLNASKQNTIDDLTALAPILGNLASAGSAFPKSLQVLATYPFTDAATQGILGDYLNSYVVPEYRTAGGVVVKDTVGTASSGTSSPARAAAASTPPAGLLPATSSAASGLPATLPVSPSGGGR